MNKHTDNAFINISSHTERQKWFQCVFWVLSVVPYRPKLCMHVHFDCDMFKKIMCPFWMFLMTKEVNKWSLKKTHANNEIMR